MLDWDDLRYFLSIARLGNLSAAAKELRVAQSTVGRRLASLEASLGVRLLNRTPNGYVSTAAGQEVLAKAEQIQAEALSLERDVGSRDTAIAGLVRVTCTESVASHIIAPFFSDLHRKHPDIVVELIPDARELSLSMREADIALRLTQSNRHDLMTRRVGTLGFSLYASAGYLDQHGSLNVEDGLLGHHLVTQQDDIQDSEQTGWFAALAHEAKVSLRTSSHEAAVVAAVHGAGIACLARFRADQEPKLVQLPTPSPVPTTGLWLVLHKDNRSNARIRAILTLIADGIRSAASTLHPSDKPDESETWTRWESES